MSCPSKTSSCRVRALLARISSWSNIVLKNSIYRRNIPPKIDRITFEKTIIRWDVDMKRQKKNKKNISEERFRTTTLTFPSRHYTKWNPRGRDYKILFETVRVERETYYVFGWLVCSTQFKIWFFGVRSQKNKLIICKFFSPSMNGPSRIELVKIHVNCSRHV